jgi:hypothetical protein
MDQSKINQKFKQVSDEVEKMASAQEQEARTKVSGIRDEAARKLGGLIGSK